MTRKMIINAKDPHEVRIAIIRGGKLEDLDIESRSNEKNKGNIYLARVVDVEPSLNAAFIDYGQPKQGFLTAQDVDPRLSPNTDLDPKQATYTIEQLLKPNQNIIVQITKDEVGAKGAVLTTYPSLAGRYMVLRPTSEAGGVSRRIQDEKRQALFDKLSEIDVPQNAGVILRTAGQNRPVDQLQDDLNGLTELWKQIESKAKGTKKVPRLLFQEQDVIIRALRDYFTPDIDEVVLDSDEAYDQAAEYMELAMPQYASTLTRYVERRPIFHHYRIEEQIADLFTPRVPLPSGGSIVIEQTEALVSIDVNSGKQKHGGHEETALQTNLEAAVEVARQLRLRDLGGIIVIDFIDMTQRKNEARVERAMKHCVQVDKARIKMGRISRNGTLELTRQRIRTSLASSVFKTCHLCNGTGRLLQPHSHASAVMRRLLDRASRGDLLSATIKLESEAANILKTVKWQEVQEVERLFGIRVEIASERTLGPGQDDFTFSANPDIEPTPLPEPNFGPAVLPDELRAELEAAESTESDTEQELFEMPMFELVDPKTIKKSNKDSGRSNQRHRGSQRQRSPSRQPKRQQSGPPEMSAAEALAGLGASASPRQSSTQSSQPKRRQASRSKTRSQKMPPVQKPGLVGRLWQWLVGLFGGSAATPALPEPERQHSGRSGRHKRHGSSRRRNSHPSQRSSTAKDQQEGGHSNRRAKNKGPRPNHPRKAAADGTKQSPKNRGSNQQEGRPSRPRRRKRPQRAQPPSAE